MIDLLFKMVFFNHKSEVISILGDTDYPLLYQTAYEYIIGTEEIIVTNIISISYSALRTLLSFNVDLGDTEPVISLSQQFFKINKKNNLAKAGDVSKKDLAIIYANQTDNPIASYEKLVAAIDGNEWLFKLRLEFEKIYCDVSLVSDSEDLFAIHKLLMDNIAFREQFSNLANDIYFSRAVLIYDDETFRTYSLAIDDISSRWKEMLLMAKTKLEIYLNCFNGKYSYFLNNKHFMPADRVTAFLEHWTVISKLIKETRNRLFVSNDVFFSEWTNNNIFDLNIFVTSTTSLESLITNELFSAFKFYQDYFWKLYIENVKTLVTDVFNARDISGLLINNALYPKRIFLLEKVKELWFNKKSLFYTVFHPKNDPVSNLFEFFQDTNNNVDNFCKYMTANFSDDLENETLFGMLPFNRISTFSAFGKLPNVEYATAIIEFLTEVNSEWTDYLNNLQSLFVAIHQTNVAFASQLINHQDSIELSVRGREIMRSIIALENNIEDIINNENFSYDVVAIQANQFLLIEQEIEYFNAHVGVIQSETQEVSNNRLLAEIKINLKQNNELVEKILDEHHDVMFDETFYNGQFSNDIQIALQKYLAVKEFIVKQEELLVDKSSTKAIASSKELVNWNTLSRTFNTEWDNIAIQIIKAKSDSLSVILADIVKIKLMMSELIKLNLDHFFQLCEANPFFINIRNLQLQYNGLFITCTDINQTIEQTITEYNNLLENAKNSVHGIIDSNEFERLFTKTYQIFERMFVINKEFANLFLSFFGTLQNYHEFLGCISDKNRNINSFFEILTEFVKKESIKESEDINKALNDFINNQNQQEGVDPTPEIESVIEKCDGVIKSCSNYIETTATTGYHFETVMQVIDMHISEQEITSDIFFHFQIMFENYQITELKSNEHGNIICETSQKIINEIKTMNKSFFNIKKMLVLRAEPDAFVEANKLMGEEKSNMENDIVNKKDIFELDNNLHSVLGFDTWIQNTNRFGLFNFLVYYEKLLFEKKIFGLDYSGLCLYHLSLKKIIKTFEDYFLFRLSDVADIPADILLGFEKSFNHLEQILKEAETAINFEKIDDEYFASFWNSATTNNIVNNVRIIKAEFLNCRERIVNQTINAEDGIKELKVLNEKANKIWDEWNVNVDHTIAEMEKLNNNFWNDKKYLSEKFHIKGVHADDKLRMSILSLSKAKYDVNNFCELIDKSRRIIFLERHGDYSKSMAERFYNDHLVFFDNLVIFFEKHKAKIALLRAKITESEADPFFANSKVIQKIRNELEHSNTRILVNENFVNGNIKLIKDDNYGWKEFIKTRFNKTTCPELSNIEFLSQAYENELIAIQKEKNALTSKKNALLENINERIAAIQAVSNDNPDLITPEIQKKLENAIEMMKRLETAVDLNDVKLIIEEIENAKINDELDDLVVEILKNKPDIDDKWEEEVVKFFSFKKRIFGIWNFCH